MVIFVYRLTTLSLIMQRRINRWHGINNLNLTWKDLCVAYLQYCPDICLGGVRTKRRREVSDCHFFCVLLTNASQNVHRLSQLARNMKS